METPNRIFCEIGHRLGLIRRMFNLSQTAMAHRMSMPITRWNNDELGISMIPVREALKLKRMLPGLSIDWIYDGDRSRLSVELAGLLEAAEMGNKPPLD